MPLVLGFVALLGAALLLTSAVTDASFADVIHGKAGQIYKSPSPSSSSTTPAASSPTTTPTPSGPAGSLTGEVGQIAKKKGWNATQIADWLKVISRESGGSLTAKNPTSGAYGIAQFINGPSEYATYGGDSTTLTGQLTAMANYITQRYGNPSAAWAHELSAGWY
ncbi:MAG TPA: phage tail tip lysozyme [Solirubrobacteraceae bacterium]|nr:phage tail tip lysozyme [Solirubrobacteraceae bacterium]